MTELIELLREKSVRFGTFTLASGKTSDFYVDARQTTLHAIGSVRVAEAVLNVLNDDVVGVGGLTLGADPIACATSTLSSLKGRPIHAFLIRKAVKGHGTGKRVEGMGNLSAGDKVAIVEDTTTTGGSLLQAVEQAEAVGLVVTQCITVVDRQEGASERIAAAGHTLTALVTRDMLETQ